MMTWNKSVDKLRVVFDTNVFIAGALKSGLVRELLHRSVRGELNILTSQEILQELQEKLSGKFHWDKKHIDEFRAFLQSTSVVISVISKVTDIKKDPDDNKVLTCALDGKAHLIISSDRHLLKLKVWRGIAIVHPKTLSWMMPKQ